MTNRSSNILSKKSNFSRLKTLQVSNNNFNNNFNNCFRKISESKKIFQSDPQINQIEIDNKSKDNIFAIQNVLGQKSQLYRCLRIKIKKKSFERSKSIFSKQKSKNTNKEKEFNQKFYFINSFHSKEFINQLSIQKQKKFKTNETNYNSYNTLRLMETQREFKNQLLNQVEGKSLMFFNHTNNFRLFLAKVTFHKNFERIMFILIIFSSFVFVAENPYKNPNSNFNYILYYLDVFMTIIYFFEMFIQVVAFGLIFGKNSYFQRTLWNVFDFSILIISIISIFNSSLKVIKILRALRILKMVEKNPGLKLITNTLFKVIPNLLRLMIFSLVFFFIYGIFAMKYLKGSFYHCVNLNSKFSKFIINKNDCFDFGGDWINQDLNFDNIFQTVSSLFQIATSEGWINTVFETTYIKKKN